VFPSATSGGRNLVVYLANAGAESVTIRNRDEILAVLRPGYRRRIQRAIGMNAKVKVRLQG
jgi:hypothetical protein